MPSCLHASLTNPIGRGLGEELQCTRITISGHHTIIVEQISQTGASPARLCESLSTENALSNSRDPLAPQVILKRKDILQIVNNFKLI